MVRPRAKLNSEKLRDQIVEYFSVLRVPVRPDYLDAALTRAERERLSHLEFLQLIIGQQANERRERCIERRVRQAHFADVKMLEDFDWEFNRKVIDRAQIEALATCDFIRRGENLAVVGLSGVGKSHLMQAIGRQGCVLGYRVRYTTSADLLADLTASLADRTLPQRLRYYARFDLLIIDEFGLDKIERLDCPEAASLLYKVVDSRRRRLSTIVITNVDFDGWTTYLGDPPLAMALLDRVVDNATILRINGKSYRAHGPKKSRTKPPKE